VASSSKSPARQVIVSRMGTLAKVSGSWYYYVELPPGPNPERDLALRRKTAWAITKVTEDMSGRYAFNTAIAALMSLSNHCSRALQDGASTDVAREAVSTLASLLQPVRPVHRQRPLLAADRQVRLAGACAAAVAVLSVCPQGAR
jgi:hypothetical protein